MFWFGTYPFIGWRRTMACPDGPWRKFAPAWTFRFHRKDIGHGYVQEKRLLDTAYPRVKRAFRAAFESLFLLSPSDLCRAK